MVWTTEQIIDFLKARLDIERRNRIKMQIELNCLSKEIDKLEDLIFKIEHEIEDE